MLAGISLSVQNFHVVDAVYVCVLWEVYDYLLYYQ